MLDVNATSSPTFPYSAPTNNPFLFFLLVLVVVVPLAVYLAFRYKWLSC